MTKKEIWQEYQKWAATHSPDWNTNNLVGNLLGWPKWYNGIEGPDWLVPKVFKEKDRTNSS
jgi:hypothetical protein